MRRHGGGVLCVACSRNRPFSSVLTPRALRLGEAGPPMTDDIAMRLIEKLRAEAVGDYKLIKWRA